MHLMFGRLYFASWRELCHKLLDHFKLRQFPCREHFLSGVRRAKKLECIQEIMWHFYTDLKLQSPQNILHLLPRRLQAELRPVHSKLWLNSMFSVSENRHLDLHNLSERLQSFQHNNQRHNVHWSVHPKSLQHNKLQFVRRKWDRLCCLRNKILDIQRHFKPMLKSLRHAQLPRLSDHRRHCRVMWFLQYWLLYGLLFTIVCSVYYHELSAVIWTRPSLILLLVYGRLLLKQRLA